MSRKPCVQETSRVRRRAFTVIELLVAASLTLLIAAAIVTLMSNALASWTRSHGALTTDGQARLVLDQLEHDLQGAIYRADGRVWLSATVQASTSVSPDWIDGTKPVAASLDPAAASLPGARFGLAGVWLRFFTTAPAGAPSGNLPALSGVSYQIVRRSPAASGRPVRYLLYRAELTTADTFAAGFDLGSPGYDPAILEPSPGRILARPAAMQVLADNVVDFGIRFYSYTTNPVTGDAQLRWVFPADASDLEFHVQSTAESREADLPAVVEVLLRVLTPEGARKIAALEAGTMTGDWWEIAGANSKVFTRRIRLPAGSL